jgi:hypothetical protein
MIIMIVHLSDDEFDDDGNDHYGQLFIVPAHDILTYSEEVY